MAFDSLFEHPQTISPTSRVQVEAIVRVLPAKPDEEPLVPTNLADLQAECVAGPIRVASRGETTHPNICFAQDAIGNAPGSAQSLPGFDALFVEVTFVEHHAVA